MELKNKKIVILGDSITQGALASSYNKSFVGILQNDYKLDVLNYGVSGTRIARQRAPFNNETIYDYDFNLRLEVMVNDADIVVVFGGTNDYGHGDASFLGDDIYSFKGALKILSNNLKEKYKDATIIFITPLQRMCAPEKGYSIPLLNYVDAIKKEASSNGFNILDLYNDKDFEAGSELFRKNISEDGLHPNDNGHLLLAKKIFKYLSEL